MYKLVGKQERTNVYARSVSEPVPNSGHNVHGLCWQGPCCLKYGITKVRGVHVREVETLLDEGPPEMVIPALVNTKLRNSRGHKTKKGSEMYFVMHFTKKLGPSECFRYIVN